MASTPGAVNAHTHLYSGLAPLADAPAGRSRRRAFERLERVWWPLDRALDRDAPRRRALPRRPRAARRDHRAHRPPRVAGVRRGSLDVLADVRGVPRVPRGRATARRSATAAATGPGAASRSASGSARDRLPCGARWGCTRRSRCPMTHPRGGGARGALGRRAPRARRGGPLRRAPAPAATTAPSRGSTPSAPCAKGTCSRTACGSRSGSGRWGARAARGWCRTRARTRTTAWAIPRARGDASGGAGHRRVPLLQPRATRRTLSRGSAQRTGMTPRTRRGASRAGGRSSRGSLKTPRTRW